jgi:hypothetical protein
MRPFSYVKTHPTATVVTFALGMMIGPWVLNTVNRTTGVGVSLPKYGNGG